MSHCETKECLLSKDRYRQTITNLNKSVSMLSKRIKITSWIAESTLKDKLAQLELSNYQLTATLADVKDENQEMRLLLNSLLNSPSRTSCEKV